MARSLLNELSFDLVRLSFGIHYSLNQILVCLLLYRLKYFITLSVKYLSVWRKRRNTHSWKTWKMDLQVLHCSSLGFLLSKLPKRTLYLRGKILIIRFCKHIFKPNSSLCLKTSQPSFSSLCRNAKLCNKTTLDAHVRILLSVRVVKSREEYIFSKCFPFLWLY